jgi:chemotaxis protein CheD
MNDLPELKKVNLGIGGIYVTGEPAEVSTVLGSCVSVCLFDESRGIAGINHYMLPHPHEGRAGDVGRFGELSIPDLFERMRRLGATKVFGGARMLAQFSTFSGISEANVEVAMVFLKRFQIRIVATDVGGTRGRKIMFRTDTGRVFVRQVGTKEEL